MLKLVKGNILLHTTLFSQLSLIWIYIIFSNNHRQLVNNITDFYSYPIVFPSTKLKSVAISTVTAFMQIMTSKQYKHNLIVAFFSRLLRTDGKIQICFMSSEWYTWRKTTVEVHVQQSKLFRYVSTLIDVLLYAILMCHFTQHEMFHILFRQVWLHFFYVKRITE